MRHVIFFAVAIALSACSTTSKNLRPASNVCISLSGISQHEKSFTIKKAASYLREYGFSYSEISCDVQVSFQSFGSNQTEEVSYNGLWVSRDSYHNQEGTVTVKSNGAIIVEDSQVRVRGYSTRPDALDGLAWEVVKPVTKNFKPVK